MCFGRLSSEHRCLHLMHQKICILLRKKFSRATGFLRAATAWKLEADVKLVLCILRLFLILRCTD